MILSHKALAELFTCADCVRRQAQVVTLAHPADSEEIPAALLEMVKNNRPRLADSTLLRLRLSPLSGRCRYTPVSVGPGIATPQRSKAISTSAPRCRRR